MFKNSIEELFQSKNVMMFVTAMFFMMGILAFFNNCIVPVALIITIILSVLLLKKLISYKYILLFGFIFYFGFFNASLRFQSEDGLVKFAPSDCILTGKIVSIPNGNVQDKVKFFFDVSNIDGENVKGKTLVRLHNTNGEFSNLNIGNTYKISGKLRTPFHAGNPSQFDYGKYLRNFNTYTVLYAENSDCEYVVQKLTPKWKFMQELNNLRNRIVASHLKYLKSPNLEILGGIVFGDDAVAPPDYIKDYFKNSGLLHILAASGMNVAIIYGFWYFILRRLRAPYKLTVVTGMGVVILYTFMTGLGASVIRAALMLLFILCGKLIDRDTHSIALLAFVASLMLVYNPAFVNDVGFQLSFIVTFGLLTTANSVMPYIHKLKIPDWLGAEILIPVVAQIWAAPIQMFYFNSFSTYSILANISIMPFLSVISFAGFISSILAVIPAVADWVCRVCDFILKYFLNILVWLSEFFSNLPYALIQTPHPSVFQVMLFYIIILVLTLMFKFGFSKKKFITATTLVVLLLMLAVPYKNNTPEILAFDVGNADAFLLKTPENKYFLIDTGKSGYNNGVSQAKVIILKYLKDRGIKDIEGLIITHFDNDHSGGAVDLINNLKIKNIYINSLDNKTSTSKMLYTVLNEKGMKPIVAQNNEIIYKEDNLTITTFRANEKSDNENSIITLFKSGNFESLFMGDAGSEAFKNIKKDLNINRLEVLKVGHHGGKGVVNSDMLESLNPAVSLISTGQNKFGHPNKVTIDALRDTDIYRTDKHNAIKISVKNNKYEVMTYDTAPHKFRVVKDYPIE